MTRRALLTMGTLGFFCAAAPFSQAATAKQPISVNGDTVEFLANGREVTAEGHVEILYQDTVLRCDSVHVFLDEKLAIADGNVFFAKTGGQEMRGEMLIYDFGDHSGTIIEPQVIFAPYYGRASLMEKVSDTEFLMQETLVSSCDLPDPHWGLRSREVNIKPGDTLEAHDTRVMLGRLPIMYLPYFSQKLTDKKPRLMVTPGNTKEFGMELFGAWRYYLNKNARGVVHVDWYQKKGWAQGADLSYDTKLFGGGQAKYYRIDEEDTREGIPDARKRRNERSRLELRHRWAPTPADQVVLEYFREPTFNFRKDYFFHEYVKQPNPRSFFLYSRAFPQATVSLLGEPRVNDWQSVLQKTPELKLETINLKMFDSPLYYKDTTTVSVLSNTVANSSATSDVTRSDNSQQISYPFRFMDLDVNPFVGHRDTYYSRGIDPDNDFWRGAMFTGIDVSKRLYRVFDVETQAMGLDIHKLRHVVTPQVQYRYQRHPTVDNARITQMDTLDNVDLQDYAVFSLENKLQTKRGENTVDLGTLILSTDYHFERNDTVGGGFETYGYDLEFKPYAWWEFDSDASFDIDETFFRYLNADLWAHMGRVSASTGYRFKKDESSQTTAGLTWTLNPFWKLGMYERFEFKTGDLMEQEYRLTRDMHCWLMELIVNQRDAEGISFLLAFTLKAFPDIGIEAETTVHPPREAL